MIQINATYLAFTLVPAILHIGILLYIFFSLPKGKTTALFSLIVAALLLWQTETVIAHLSPSEAVMMYWDKLLCIGWISLAPLVFHFCCLFAGMRSFTTRRAIILIYLPFLFLHQVHIVQQEADFVYKAGWGWVHTPLPGSVDAVIRILMSLYVLGSIAILIRYAYDMRYHADKKMQSMLVAAGIGIPALQGIITQVVFPFFLGRHDVPLTATFLTFFSVATLISLTRFRMFNIADSIQLETVLANLKEIVLIVSPAGRVIYMNPYTRSLFNRMNETDSLPLENLFANDTACTFFRDEVFETALKGRTTRNFTTSFSVCEKEHMDVLVSAEPVLNNGQIQGILLVGNDITEQLKTIEALKYSNERFQLVSKATNDMVWDWNLETGVVYRNKEGWRRLFQAPPGRELGTEACWEEMVHPEDRAQIKLIKDRICNSPDEEFFEIECRVMKHDGSIAYVHDRGFVIRDNNGKATRLIGAAQDITDRKETEKKLQEEQSRMHKEITEAVIMAQENERKTIGGELHDNVNQILATSLLYLKLGRKNDDQSGTYLQKTEDIITSAIMEVRKLSHNMIPPSLDDMTLEDALNNLVDMVRETRLMHVRADLSHFDESNVPGNLKLSLYRIIQEQCNNIIKYAQATKVHLQLSNEGGLTKLTIEDDGVGFDPACKSNGVGLMNMHSRASLHGGTVQIVSAPGMGCKLLVEFPEHASVTGTVEYLPETMTETAHVA